MSEKSAIKNKKATIGVILIIISLALIYIYPHIMNRIDKKHNAQIALVCKEYTQRILKGYKKTTLKDIAQKTAQEMNIEQGSEKCSLCVRYEIDTKTNTVIVTGYDRYQEVVARTSINPPSYVRYER